ncbi:MAG: hypothetical protein GC172_00300 [Phycisphaera sp.]|nr:hypothetical protein [Phycisphaera sp.]
MPFHASAVRTLSASVLAACCAASLAAQHIGDINLTVDDGAIHTGATTATGVEAERVFGATFGDTGVARFTSNPGFEAAPGTFATGSRVGFTPRTGLLRFTGSAVEPVANERLEVKFLTLVSVLGAEPVPGFDLAVQSNGGWHRHLGFRLFAAKGSLPPSGIYAFELELYSNDGVTLPSAPFWLVLNDGRSTEELEAAVAWIDANLVDGGAPCPADLDGDGAIGASDLATLLAAWGTDGADLSGDGLTDAGDLATLLASWGACP